MRHTHLTETELIAMCVPGMVHDDHDAVAGCESCQRRLASLDALLEEVSVAAEFETDAAFPQDRLARQHARILQRLDQHGRAARVLHFPYAARPSMPARPMRRWVAGAAAAGLLIGMVAGHLAHELPGLHFRPGESTSISIRQPILHASSGPSDDDFFREIERAAVSSSPEGLLPLDRVTPVAWEQR